MEILIAVGIMMVLLTISLPFTLNFYRRYQLDSERSTALTIMREARTMSMAGDGSADHGVHIASSQYTLFEGQSYAARNQAKDQTFGRSTNVTVTGGTDILFKYLTGKSSSASFTFDNGVKTSFIYVNTEGRIDWQ